MSIHVNASQIYVQRQDNLSLQRPGWKGEVALHDAHRFALYRFELASAPWQRSSELLQILCQVAQRKSATHGYTAQASVRRHANVAKFEE